MHISATVWSDNGKDWQACIQITGEIAFSQKGFKTEDDANMATLDALGRLAKQQSDAIKRKSDTVQKAAERGFNS